MGVPLLTQICQDVTAEQIHKQLTDGKLNTRSANVTDETRLDVCAQGFWNAGQTALFHLLHPLLCLLVVVLVKNAKNSIAN